VKILIVIGTRPEAIKMAPLILNLKKEKYFKVKVCVTAQHRRMLDEVLNLFRIKPDYDLNLMKKNQSINDIASKIIKKIDNVLNLSKPDLVLVHGDTSTTLYSAIASFNKKIKIGHIEAGLRTFNLDFPWPEESNRQIVSKLSSFHFAPTKIAKQNLIQEGIKKKDVFVTGNTIIDSLLIASKLIDSKKALKKELENKFKFLKKEKKLILVTGHRRENFGKSLKNICSALKQLSKLDIEIIYPVHLNPKINIPVHNMLKNVKNIKLCSPLDYISFVYLMTKSYLIITDSGGIQEEAPTLGKPVLVTREVTERPEALEVGTVKLVGSNQDKIVSEATKLINNKDEYNKISFKQNPYGDGKSSLRISKILKKI
tara:strand:+ start:613 stop:1725 length:1113 start_codon:yes stop_codon:yes gene_type:complete